MYKFTCYMYVILFPGRSIERVCHLIAHTMDEALLSLRLTRELSVLPLAYQITRIAGMLWVWHIIIIMITHVHVVNFLFL